MRFTTEIDGAKKLIAKFKLVNAGLVNLNDLGTWDWVQTEFYKVMQEQFASEGAKGRSGKWKPLSPAYAVAKKKRYGAMPILQASGKLYKSLTSAGAEGSIVDKKPLELTLGTSIEYGKYHQGGTKRMPRRPPIDLTEDQEKRLLAPIEKKLKQLIANARLREARGF